MSVMFAPAKGMTAQDRRSWALNGERILSVPISQIKRDPKQPRTEFDAESIGELAASIKAHGIMVPIELREGEGNGLILVHGERRFRAAKKAGLKQIRAVVKPSGDEFELRVRQLIENLQREDLSVLDQAKAFQALIDAGKTQSAIAKAIGKDRTTVTKSLVCGRFFESLPANLKRECERVHLPFRVLYRIASQKPPKKALGSLMALFDESPEKGKKKLQKASKPVSVPTTGALSKALGKVETKDLSKILLDILPASSVSKIYQVLSSR